MPPTFLIQVAVAGVWLYEGFWNKLLGKAGSQNDVVESHPMFDSKTAGLFLKALGAVETLLALWILSGVLPFWAAVAQTVLLVVLNANGLLFARNVIHDPGGMVVKNFALLVLAWVAAGVQTSGA